MKRSRKMMITILFIGGLTLFLYPSISNYITMQNMERAIITYNDELSGYTNEMIELELEKAKHYNREIKNSSIEDPFLQKTVIEPWNHYNDILNINGIMGYIDIPKISVHLPIYHGVSETSLRNGVGHIKATQLPIGGKGNYSILTGHRGLPEAELLTHLDKIKLKDKFYINVLGKKLAYQVNQIKIIEPEDISSLKPTLEKDYVILITCTPYGINSQRLIIRGERCAYKEGEDTMNKEFPWNLYVCIVVALLSLIIYLIYHEQKEKQK